MLDKLVAQTLVSDRIPHMGTANIKLICDRPTNQTRTDSIGNQRPVFIEEIIWLSLREDRQSKIPPPAEGSRIKQLPMIGRSANPKLLPSWLSIKQKYKAEMVDANSGAIAVGEFEFDAIAQHRVPAFTLLRGSFVKGTFTVIQ